MLVLNLLLIGLAISLEPIPLTAFILVLASRNGVRKGAGFIFGWLASLAVVIAVTVLVTGNQPPKSNTAPSLAALAVKILIGVVLIYIAVTRWRKMGQPKPPKKTPKWQTGIDNMSPWFAIALGPLTQPWGLVAAGVAVIVDAKLSNWQDYFALFLFCRDRDRDLPDVWRSTPASNPTRPRRSWPEQEPGSTPTPIRSSSSCPSVLGFWLVGYSIYLIVT